MPSAQSAVDKTYPAPRSFRLDAEASTLLVQLSKKLGVSQSDIVRLSIRAFADQKLKAPAAPKRSK